MRRLGWVFAAMLSVAPAAVFAQTPDQQAPDQSLTRPTPEPQPDPQTLQDPEAVTKLDPEVPLLLKEIDFQDPQKPKEGPPPVANENKPTRNFGSALVHNIGDDFKHLPRMNTVYWLAGGGALAAAVHPADKKLNSHLVGTANGFWKAGEYIGETPTILGAAAALYLVGHHKGSQRLMHLGMDEIEATLISEGLLNLAKVTIRRKRPIRADGTRAAGWAMPSGHAWETFAAATVLQQHLGYKAGLPTYLIASYVAISRLHDNVHYISDVVMGAAAGIVIGRTVTWHGRNFYGSPMLVPGGAGVIVNFQTGDR